MKRILLLVIALVSCTWETFAGLPRGWTDDLDEAKKAAAESGKHILMVFSGSDWCGWCVKFDKDTLSKPEFVKAARLKYELVMIDSPKNKSILSEKARVRNPKLVTKYDIHGYPSYVLTDPEGAVVARSAGYVKGGPKAFLAKLDDMLRNAPTKKITGNGSGKKEGRVVKGSCDCGPECWEKLLCKCCKQNNGKCCRREQPTEVKSVAVGDQIERRVASWVVFTEDRDLAEKVDETANFLEAILEMFDKETSGYYRTMDSWYDGILVHRDMSQRGKRDLFVGPKRYLNLYAPDSLKTWSWCSSFCGNFLSRCKKEPLPDKERETILLYVAARVAKWMEIDGGTRQLERFASEASGMGRLLHEMCAVNDEAIKRYYAAKITLCETGRFGPYISLADMAEVFSGVLNRNVFTLFQKYYKPVRKQDVTVRLRGFAEECASEVK